MNLLLAQRLVNGMARLDDILRNGGSHNDLISRTSNVLACLEQFVMSDENFANDERELIVNITKRQIKEDDVCLRDLAADNVRFKPGV